MGKPRSVSSGHTQSAYQLRNPGSTRGNHFSAQPFLRPLICTCAKNVLVQMCIVDYKFPVFPISLTTLFSFSSRAKVIPDFASNY